MWALVPKAHRRQLQHHRKVEQTVHMLCSSQVLEAKDVSAHGLAEKRSQKSEFLRGLAATAAHTRRTLQSPHLHLQKKLSTLSTFCQLLCIVAGDPQESGSLQTEDQQPVQRADPESSAPTVKHAAPKVEEADATNVKGLDFNGAKVHVQKVLMAK